MRKIQGKLILCLRSFKDLFAPGERGEVIAQGGGVPAELF